MYKEEREWWRTSTPVLVDNSIFYFEDKNQTKKIISLLKSGSNEIAPQTYWVLKKNTPNAGAADYTEHGESGDKLATYEINCQY